ncbi:BolA family protein [Methylocapsa palsarum]|uniref:BolA protein n=1 Tax=Methylocapsa palsarum TaxID=1612308 RepID=A0A1I4AHC8_9HYPH|nr:BolA family protein [Methylocapsa palsarum]SFK55331.1 BolA protein [Methylocapsa palsarum]
MSDHNQASAGDRIRSKLKSAFDPVLMEVIDESRKHAGHAHLVTQPGTAGGAGETHFKIKVVADAFKGKSRIDRHRAINDLLRAELNGGVHALAIEAKAPGEV